MSDTAMTHAADDVTIKSMRDGPREDDGYYGPDSVTWKVVSHPAGLNVGGGVAVLLQVLEPGEMWHLSKTSVANEGGAAADSRFKRTGAYLITVNFGDKAHADAAAAHVDRLHERSIINDPETGAEISRAKTDDWLRWTHNTFVWGALTSALEYGLELTPAEQDQFVREQHKSAELLHVPGPLPSTKAELDAEIEGWGERAALTLPAASIAISLRNPAPGQNAIARWVARNTQYGLLALLPGWAQQLYGLDDLNDKRAQAGKRWMGRFLKLAAKNKTMEGLIADATEQATVHPYQKVRGKRRGGAA